MDFSEQVFSEFRRRIESGQNEGLAKAFNISDFPNATKEDVSDFCAMGYAQKMYYGNFSLTKSGIEEALK